MPDTKEMVLSYLEENRGQFSSGEAIATKLNISRNSVWKAIESLRREG
jgi:BirA family biotin operon repressor/biotin-[acetyl-CoA-carboxylase] ligase